MANAFYRLRKTKSKQAEIIYLGFRFGQDQLIYSTGIKVMPKHWDAAKSRVKNIIEIQNRDEINAFLFELSEFTNSLSNLYKVRKLNLTKELLKSELDKYLSPAVQTPTVSFFDFIDQFIADLESGARMIKGHKIADPKTVQRYRTAKKSLLEFQSSANIDITFQGFDEALWDTYIRYLTFVKKYKINNIGFYQKQISIYLKAARKEGIFYGDWIDSKTVLSENPDDVFWDKKELAHMESYDLSANPRLDRIRDLTLVGCNTGFRISDWKQIHSENIHVTAEGNKYLEIVPDKENAPPPSTPLFPIVERILQKYDGRLPIISDQKYNEALKDLCKLIGQTKKVKVRYVQEGKLVNKSVEKYTQVSSHTCRRSFATNLFLDGFEPYLIMKATGHTSEKNFRKYLKLDSSGSVDAIAKKVRLTRGLTIT